MDWVERIGKAIDYIEEHLSESLEAENIAKENYTSVFHFQRVFSIVAGISLGEYIRNRRLSLAGEEIKTGTAKVIDIALKYGYESPDSFAKAFTRFHGVTPSQARKEQVTLKSFAPLKIKFTLEGGYLMDYKIVKKEEFKVLANAKTFSYEGAKEVVPLFWQQHYKEGKGQTVMGVFGINLDPQMGSDTFEYLIADPYNPTKDVPDGFEVRTIPAFTWAVFPCKGAMPTALQDVNKKIFSEWLPALKDYEFAAGYCVEYYDDPTKYAKGTQDENYYCEIWIPVKQK